MCPSVYNGSQNLLNTGLYLAAAMKKEDAMGKDVIIACDFNSKEEVIGFLGKFQDEKPFVKIGMELFYAEGPEIVRTIKGMGHKIFQIGRAHV